MKIPRSAGNGGSSDPGNTEDLRHWLGWSEGLAQALQELESGRQTFTFPKGAALFHQGSECSGVHLLLFGRAKLITVSDTGRSFILRISRAGAVLGLGPALTSSSYDVTAEAMEPVQAAFIPRKDLLGLLCKPETASHIVYHLAMEIRLAGHRLGRQALLSNARARVAGLFLDWIATNHSARPTPCIYLTHQDIAGLTDLSRETVTRHLHELQQGGFVDLSNNGHQPGAARYNSHMSLFCALFAFCDVDHQTEVTAVTEHS